MSSKRKPVASKQPPKTDGWSNILTGMGLQQYDRKVSTKFAPNARLAEMELTNLFVDDGFIQRIVTLPANDMVRAWFRVEGDDDGEALKQLDALKAKQAFRRALAWARLYGGGLIVMGINDGQTLDVPVNTGAIKSVEFLRVYGRYQAWESSRYNDPKMVNFGAVEKYTVNPPRGTPFVVHETRTLIFDGVDVPDLVREMNQGWGDSIVQAVYERVRGLGEAYSNVEHIIGEFIIGMLTMNNLAGLIGTGKDDVVMRRLNQIDMSKHVINSVLLDSNEKYERVSSTVAGLPDLMDRLALAVSAVTGIPVTLLMGQAPAGLSATGDSDIRLYYDNIHAAQETSLAPQLQKLLTYLYAADSMAEDDWHIIFNPLWQPTGKEQAEIHNIQATADKTYIDAGVLSADEVANSRFGGNVYSMDTALAAPRDEITPDDLAEEASKAAEEQAAAAAKATAAQPPVKPAQGAQNAA